MPIDTTEKKLKKNMAKIVTAKSSFLYTKQIEYQFKQAVT